MKSSRAAIPEVVKKNNCRRLMVALCLFLFALHVVLSKNYTRIINDNRSKLYETFYVFKPEGYKLIALGMDDTASRINLIYTLITPVNMNIPSTDFKRLTASLEGCVSLDPQNIAPYMTVAYYWSWAKNVESRQLMVNFMEKGVDAFKENWEIPYGIYNLARTYDNETAIKYIKIAAERSAAYGGPDWIVDFPAILMKKDGEELAAFLWLVETIKITSNEKQREAILERMKLIEESYSGDKKSYMSSVINQLEGILNEKK